MKEYQLDKERYKALARQAVAEGCVLLCNNNHALPIRKGETVSVFGRSQMNYYKSGTGSGGMVNTEYVVSIPEGLANAPDISVNRKLWDVYRDWVTAHPFDVGKGWAGEPWYQEEMPLTDSLVRECAQESDIAVVILGRTAGEERDNVAKEGGYYLTQAELKMLATVRRGFHRMAVVLNVGNLIDMNWVDTYRPDAVLYGWQGGQEGGNGVADVLTGKVNPCGRMSDTIARQLSDYPAHSYYGHKKESIYAEDIYVGYRYFETFAKDKVLYPFGFGLSYTTFAYEVKQIGALSFQVAVTNTGSMSGKDVVQVYVQAPQGKLGKPARVLVDFQKTRTLKPGEKQTLSFMLNERNMASYDDSGCTGHKSCYVLEAGEYRVYIGANVRNAVLAGTNTIPKMKVVEQLSEAMAPTKSFRRLKCVQQKDGSLVASQEPVPLRTISLKERIARNRPETYPCTGNKGYQLSDVLNGNVSMQTFLAQLTDAELACLMRGEGMCSPKVTPGTAAAYGGVTEALQAYGIPVGCCADGPSGIRMESGAKAFSLPNGTALACTFNRALNDQLFQMLGAELGKNRIDTLLGPGINIHRYPLNGRNFEYFSEDPYLTGQIAAAQLKGMHRQGTTGTIKHFCCNNQEYHRRECNAVVSERALREIYLKGFEIAVKEGGAHYLMTSYNPVNGIWSAGNYDLNTTILRGEWGFSGMVMTDWWAEINEEGGPQSKTNLGFMVRAQNDVYMVTEDSKAYAAVDNIASLLAQGGLTRGELQRNAANICRVLMKSNAMSRLLHPQEYAGEKQPANPQNALFTENVTFYEVKDGSVIHLDSFKTERGSRFLLGLHVMARGEYEIALTAASNASALAQLALNITVDGLPAGTLIVSGTGGKWVKLKRKIMLLSARTYLGFEFMQSGIQIKDLRFQLIHQQ